MTPENLIDECRKSGVLIDLAGDGLKLRGAPDAVQAAANRLRPHKPLIVEYLRLRQFQLDQVKEDIADGYPADELTRVNNMAWEFMEADGMPFDQAIKAAAEIVATCAAVECEKAYVNVLQLWERLKSTSNCP